MKRGFTLIELLAVIIVLAIIIVITIPNVLSTMDKAKDKALEVYMNKIERAGKEYGMIHPDEYKPTDGDKQDFAAVYLGKGLKYIEFFGNEDFKILTGENSKYFGMAYFFSDDDVYIAIADKDYKRCIVKDYSGVYHIKGEEACKFFKNKEQDELAGKPLK